MDDDSQISKYTQTEEDQYEMQVRAANIVSCFSMCSNY